ncbi:MAG: APC family permease [Gordonibacter sp.]|uniref:APC family permease n=1 Tax=Gordonibacter sp. TaxID=1968902 RepID=UPI002FCB2327
MNANSWKYRLLGKPLKSSELESQKYGVIWGLPVLSSDAISSVAYACEEILLVFIPILALASYTPMLGVAGAIIALLLMLILCYRQVIDAYPQGGGAYSVARENLGRIPSLVAASGLIIGYVLTIAVSSCSGAAAVTSALPAMAPFKVPMIVAFIVIMTVGNLRGLRESSKVFGLPTYFFVASVLIMIVVGVVKSALGMLEPAAQAAELSQTAGDLTLFLVLRAFSSGCSALTGVEAISNSVPNFAQPARKNAKATLNLLGLIVLVIFGGVCVLALLCRVAPSPDLTIIAQIATSVFGGNSIMFYVIQIATALILLLAANTAYNGMPQLMSLLSQDGFLPKRFSDKGSRLVYSNGILFASVFAVVLVVAFAGDTHLLIPLYAAGVFLSFTIAQGGMVVHWRRHRSGPWMRRACINGFGAVVTALVLCVIVATNFLAGAWISLVAIGATVALMAVINRHYRDVHECLMIRDDEKARSLLLSDVPRTHVIIPAHAVNRPFIKTLNYARSLSSDIEVYHVKVSAAATRRFKADYQRLGIDAPLVIEKAPYRNVNEMLINHVDDRLGRLQRHETLTIVMPQLVTKLWQMPLHNQTTLLLESSLLERRDVALVTIPYLIDT